MPVIEATLEKIQDDGGLGSKYFLTDWPYVFGDDGGGSTCHNGEAACPEAVPPGSRVDTSRLYRRDIAEVIASVEGVPDEEDWLAVFRMTDGRYACIRAGCDYTGWG